jgi:hypothetical protein
MTTTCRVRPGLAVAATVAALVIAVSGCGSSSTTSTTGAAGSPGTTTAATSTGGTSSGGPGTPGIPRATLTVTPTSGDQYTKFTFGFTAPDASGRHGTTDSSYALSVSGPHGANCTGAESSTLPAVIQGQRVMVALGPGAGDRWCAGRYTARVDELERPICTAGQMCPQFVRIVAAVGPVSFRITY